MRTATIASTLALLACLVTGSAFAQTAPPSPAPGIAPPVAGQSVDPDALRALRRQTAQACRQEAQAKGLAGPERRSAVRDCVQAKLPAVARSNRSQIKAVSEACKDEVKPQRLARPERKAAMEACMKSRRPDLARQIDCRNEAKAKGLQKGEERRAFMRSCRKT